LARLHFIENILKEEGDPLKKLIVFCILILATNSYAADSGYHIIKRLKVGGEGGWDYITIDGAERRLYISEVPMSWL
jgi:hypothetical protein